VASRWVATGALSGFGAWLMAGGYFWISGIAGALLACVALHDLRRRTRRVAERPSTIFGQAADQLLKGQHHGRIFKN
jgi:hypothetical protein